MTAVPVLHAEHTLESLLGSPLGEAGAITPKDLTLDSREVAPGSVFLALPGCAQDGRDFIPQAINAGAVAVLAEADGLGALTDARVVPVANLRQRLPGLAARFFDDPSADMAVLAVTGTNGKTSIADFIVQLLRGLGFMAGAIGTLGARLDSAVRDARNTTPDVLSITRQLAQWRATGVEHVALEASSHALDQQRLAGLKLNTAIFSNLSRDHFDYHGSEAAYAEAKLKLFSDFAPGLAIFNADDPQARRVREVTTCSNIGISLRSAEADVFVQPLRADHGLSLRLHSPWGTREVSAPLSGTFNVFNLATAIVAVAGLGYRFADVVAVAEGIQPVVGRMQRLTADRHATVVVDYAHTPDALAVALQALRPETSGQLWVVFGCGGDRDTGKRAPMGRVADQFADRVIVTSDNPRNEHPEAIVDEVCAGITGPVQKVIDRAEAIAMAIASAEPSDTVLIAGKGHEDYQDMGGQRLAFSDVTQALSCLQGGGE